MKNIKNFGQRVFRNQSGQGATEYILLLVVIVGLVLMFKGQILEAVKGKLDQLKSDIGNVTGN